MPTLSRLTARSLLVLLVALLALGDVAVAQTTPTADLVLLNGNVVTADSAFSLKQAVAIKDGKFVAVGGNDEIRRLAGPATRVIDLKGRTVLPGLFDSHIHAIRGGLTWDSELHWERVASIADGLKMISERAARLATGSWIRVAGGWHESQFAEKRLPTAAELDAAAPNHPVWLQRLYESVLLNKAGLKALGITADTPDPRAGKIVKDAAGQPYGLAGFGGINTYYARLPRPTLDEQIQGSRNWFRELNRVGLTSIGDVAGGGLIWPDGYRAVTALHDQNELTVRVRWYMQPNNPGHEFDVIRRFVKQVRPGSGDDMLRPVGVGEQILLSSFDSDNFSPTAPTFAQKALEDWREAVTIIVEGGWRFQVHATRDNSARQLLTAIEEVNRQHPLTDRRIAFAHMEDATAETIQRIKALGGGITVQDRMVFSGEDVLKGLGPELAHRAPPLQTMLKLGLPVGGGTDSTRVAPYNPFVSLWWLITGKTVGGVAVRGPAENLSREQALRLYTTGSAWFSFDEAKVGSIEPGKLADLIVLTGDYLTVLVDQIKELTSVLTIVDGKPVYAAGEYEPLARR